MDTVEHSLELIGNTPLVRAQHFDTGVCELYLKLECLNPGGSIKDRPALYMVNEAEAKGKIKPGGILIEATAGNTGLGLALVANQKGYRLRLVLPDKMSQEKIYHLKAAGAQITLTRSDVQKGHPAYYQDLAAHIASTTENAFYVNQFANPANVRAHFEMTGPEIYRQMDGDIDAFVCGVGTGATLTGVGRFLKSHSAQIEMVLADPEGSILAHYLETGEITQAGRWLVEGIGEDFIPTICDLSLADKAYTVSDKDSFLTARELFAREGILGGSSSGTLLCAALRYCQAQTKPKKVVCLVCDSGNKYFSKMFNDYWMYEQGFLARPTYGDLRDLISRPHWLSDTITIHPDDTMNQAFNRMRLYDVSQLPVVDKAGAIIGLIDESDVLWAIHHSGKCFSDPVAIAMTARLETVHYQTPITQLMAVFAKDYVAVVVDSQDIFLGIITRVDLLHHLRLSLKQW